MAEIPDKDKNVVKKGGKYPPTRPAAPQPVEQPPAAPGGPAPGPEPSAEPASSPAGAD